LKVISAAAANATTFARLEESDSEAVSPESPVWLSLLLLSESAVESS
jgi:hypothetical protein